MHPALPAVLAFLASTVFTLIAVKNPQLATAVALPVAFLALGLIVYQIRRSRHDRR